MKLKQIKIVLNSGREIESCCDNANRGAVMDSWCDRTIRNFTIRARLLLAFALAFAPHGIATAQNADLSGDTTTALAQKYYGALLRGDGLPTCRAIGEELHSRGVETGDTGLQVRGLIRQAYCELRFGSWGKKWRVKLATCEQLCEKRVSVEYAELLMFRGHLAKWRPKVTLSLIHI